MEEKKIEDIFITARTAKTKADIWKREREKINRERAIEFLNAYKFNDEIEKACNSFSRAIPPMRTGNDRELAYAIKEILNKLGYSVKISMICGEYEINVNWIDK